MTAPPPRGSERLPLFLPLPGFPLSWEHSPAGVQTASPPTSPPEMLPPPEVLPRPVAYNFSGPNLPGHSGQSLLAASLAHTEVCSFCLCRNRPGREGGRAGPGHSLGREGCWVVAEEPQTTQVVCSIQTPSCSSYGLFGGSFRALPWYAPDPSLRGLTSFSSSVVTHSPSP